MPLLSGYTIGFVNEECEKIGIDFLDPIPSEYELGEIVRFFKKYNKEVFINKADKKINFLILDYKLWVMFLLKLGFRDTATAVCEVLNDLQQNYMIDPIQYLDKIKKAKKVDITKEKSIIEDLRTDKEKQILKNKEIRLLKKNKKMERKTKMYHCTLRENLCDIFSDGGLKPKLPKNITNAKKGVYLSSHPFDWMHYVTENTTLAGAMIEIDVEGLELEYDNGINSDDWEKHPAYFYPDFISLNRFNSISISTDEKPYSFKKILPKYFKKLEEYYELE